MRVPPAIRDNLTFLVIEVGSQVAGLRSLFESGAPAGAQRVLDRSGYAYNLKMRIHDGCVETIRRGRKGDVDTLSLRAMESIATDLERITELCRDAVHQAFNIRKAGRRKNRDHATLLKKVEKGIGLIEGAVDGRDTTLALEIGRIEPRLDREFRKQVARFNKELKTRKRTEDTLSHLFIAHGIEEMGDSLLNIGEAIISANMGQPLSIDRYQSLWASVEQLEEGDSASLTVEPLAETRSGSGISGIADTNDDQDGYIAVFKDGKKRKLKEERERVESWNRIYPGLAPKILSYQKRGESAALLIEHLPGRTFEQILLRESPKLLDETLKHLKKTLRSVWTETRSKKPAAADYIGQLTKRLGDVYAVHADFQRGGGRIDGLELASFDDLLAAAGRFEEGLKAPFSVYIHGDFNLDNILFDEGEKAIRFIDLHRSGYMDYVQDVSVFMVSAYRLPALDAPMRRRARDVVVDFHDFARGFAAKAGDKTFELRLALGLARSFATSTRFILDREHAKAMFLRSRYLLESVLRTEPKSLKNYRVPVEELFVGY